MMEIFAYLQSNLTVYLVFIALIGLAVGSFLNVVIHRLPRMMENEWRAQCLELLSGAGPSILTNDDQQQDAFQEHSPHEQESSPFNLVSPRSHCPHCGHQITALENIPVLSYVLLHGKCSSCNSPISIRYPLVESLTAVFSVLVAYHFGFSLQAFFALILTWSLIALSLIDYDHQILPDSITMPVLWTGLGVSLLGLFTDPGSSIIGVIAGYLALWTVYKLFKLATGKEGMGYGDFKLLAMLGAWMGWKALPIIIIASSLVGAAFGILLILVAGRDRHIPIPFGPYLAAAGWLTFLWGDDIIQMYFNWAGIR